MPRLRRRIGLQDVGLTAFAVAATLAFARSRGKLGWWVALPFLLSSTLQLPDLPRLRRGVEVLGAALIAAVGALSALWVLYPIIGDAAVEVIPRILGIGLAALLVVAHAARPRWPLHRSFYPSGLALLGIACLDPFADVAVWIPAASAALLLAVVAGDTTLARAGGPRLLRLVGMGAIVAVASALSLGIMRVLPWAQPLVEQAVAQAISAPSGTSSSGFSDVSSLGDVEELALSRKIVMRVWTDQPRRLRGVVYGRFDGKRWHARRPAARPLAEAPGPLAPRLDEWLGPLPGATWIAERVDRNTLASPTLVRTKVIQTVPPDRSTLFVAAGAFILRLRSDSPQLDRSGVLRAVAYPPTQIYGTVSDEATLPQDSPDDDDRQLPVDLDPRIAELAKALAEGASSPAEIVTRVLAHLERECVYSLKGVRLDSSQPVAEFLFGTKRGYCEYFASAAAVLLRLGGVPARHVKGYSVTHMNAIGDHYIVREKDAHAWIEAHLPGRGWIEIDPTPASQFEAAHRGGRPGLAAAAIEQAGALVAELWLRLQVDAPGAFRWLVSVLIHEWKLVLAVVGLVALRRPLLSLLHARGFRLRLRRRGAVVARRSQHVPPELRALILRLEDRWERGGYPRPPTRGLLDHAEQVPDGASRVPSRHAACRVVACYYRARFGGIAPEPAEVEALRQML